MFSIILIYNILEKLCVFIAIEYIDIIV